MSYMDTSCLCALCFYNCSTCLIKEYQEMKDCNLQCVCCYENLSNCCLSIAMCCSLLNFSMIQPQYIEIRDTSVKIAPRKVNENVHGSI